MFYRMFAPSLIFLLLVACAGPQAPVRSADPVGAGDAPPAGEFSSPEAALNYYLMMGELALSQNDHEDAAKHYLAAMEITEDSEVAERAAQLALHVGWFSHAARAADRWRQLEQGQSGPLEIQLAAAMRGGDAASALQRAEDLLKLWGAPAAAAFQSLGRVLVEERDRRFATALAQEIARAHDTGTAWQVTGLLALRANDMETAAAAAQRARTLQPESAQAASLEARVLALTGKHEQAQALMKATVAEHPDDTALRFTLAGLYLTARQLEDARRELEHLLTQDPSYMDARWTLGMLLLQLREPVLAEAQLKEVLADPPRRFDALYYIAGSYEMREDWATALEWFDQVEWGDNAFNARIKAAHMLALLGRMDEARARLRELRAAMPAQRARLYRVEAELFIRAGDRDGALGVYDNALTELVDDAGLLYARALEREKAGRFEGAIEDLRRVHALQPDSAEAQNALGYVLADRGPREAWPEARELITKALAQQPENAAFIDSKGWVLFRLGDLAGAREWLERAWALQPDAEVGAHLGEVLWHLGERTKARAIWAAAGQIDADHRVLTETLERLDSNAR